MGFPKSSVKSQGRVLEQGSAQNITVRLLLKVYMAVYEETIVALRMREAGYVRFGWFSSLRRVVNVELLPLFS